MKKQVVVSGIQPTGNLHIGNYLGAVKNWIELQNSGQYDCYFFIADYHALTGTDSADERRQKIATVAAELLAAGVDPNKSAFFVQSHVPEHTELAWIFSTVTQIAELYRMTQFKDKSHAQEKNINAGLLTYPILQAADVLLYHGALVPVGQDQIQHVELTRDIGKWFNKRYGHYFPETKHLLTTIPKVMSLLEPLKKMSKSLGAGHVIEMREDEKEINIKLKKAVTASEGGGQAPGAQNLLGLLKIFGNETEYKQFASADKDGSIRYGDLKQALGKSLADSFADFRQRREELLRQREKLDELLERGASKARSVAHRTMTEVCELVGIK